MGETGENVAERFDVSREAQDAFALRSHQRAVAATEAGKLAEEIVPIEARRGRETVLVEADEGPRPDASPEKLAALRPVFREGGTVTAGNASTLNDGAACLLVTSEKGAEELGAEPLARVVATGVAGVDPAYMGIGPVEAVPQRPRAPPASRSTRSTWSSSTRPSPPRSSPAPASSGSTRSASTSTAARSPSATRSAAPAPASPARSSASCAAAAAGTASPPSASASARASPPSSKLSNQ